MRTPIYLTHKIRLNLNHKQDSHFNQCAGVSRFTYNWGLANWKDQYEAGNKPSWFKLNKELNAKKKTEFPWLYSVSACITNQSLQNLNRAFQGFFRNVKQGKIPGYPKFKSKKIAKPSFTIVGQALKIQGKKVKVPKLGWVRMRQELRFPGKICFGTFVKEAGHWYVSVQVKLDPTWVYPHRCESQAVIGVDLGVKDLVVLSNGDRFPAPRVLRKYEKKLRMLNKQLSRRKKGSNNRYKTRLKLQRLHKRITNIRDSATHKVSTSIVKRFKLIGMEDLNVAGMVKNHCLAKSVMDAAMGTIRRQLEYKSVLSGSTLVFADRYFPSTKTCSNCGCVLDSISLGTREWTCEHCGTHHDRDINAAINLSLIATQAMTA